MATTPSAAYRPPNAFDRRIFNPLIARLSALGVSFAGSRILEIRGRRSGQPRRNPVNPLAVDGQRYLVAPEIEVVYEEPAADTWEMQVEP